MFRLLKLAALALFGYAVYEFCRGIANDPKVQAMAGEAARKVANEAQSRLGGEQSGGMNITGPGEGTEVSTLAADGGSVRHKVGRGVVR